MTNKEKAINDLEQCLDDSVVAVVPDNLVREAIDMLKKSFTPEEVYNTVVEHGQHDKRFKLGDRIDYSFTDVVDILNIELMCKAGDM